MNHYSMGAVALSVLLPIGACTAADIADTAHVAGEATALYVLPESHEVAQSPINIQSNHVDPAHHAISLQYNDSAEHFVNLGHTVEVDYDPGSTLQYDGQRYELAQLHFHTPAEHLIDGITYPMEMHMVHKLVGNPQKYLVIGVLFREGADNPFIEEIVSHVPQQSGGKLDRDFRINARDALDDVSGYYHYEGSLTTPPYDETVTWLVMKEIHQANAAEIELLNSLEGNNARHIQALHARHVESE